MVEHLPLVVVGLVLGLIGSIFCFYYPEVLSKNIRHLKSSKSKVVFTFVVIINVVGYCILLEPESITDWFFFLFSFIFFLIACIDGYSKIIPNKLLMGLLLLAILQLFSFPSLEYLWATLFVIVSSFLIYSVGKRVTTKKIIGIGDVKLIAVLALFLGWEFLWVLYIGVICGGVFSLVGIGIGSLKRSSKISLAPFLFIGFILLEGCKWIGIVRF